MKRRCFRVLSGLALSLFAMPVLANENDTCSTPVAELVAGIQAQLIQHPVWRAEFTQNNHLKALSTPLVSEGRIFAASGQGLVWRVESPVSSQVVLNEAGVDIGAGIIAGSKLTASLLQNVLLGNFTQLESQFQMEGCLFEDNTWQIELIPSNPYLAERLRGVFVTGGSSVTLLQVNQPGDNRLDVEFAVPMSLNELPSDVAELLDGA